MSKGEFMVYDQTPLGEYFKEVDPDTSLLPSGPSPRSPPPPSLPLSTSSSSPSSSSSFFPAYPPSPSSAFSPLRLSEIRPLLLRRGSSSLALLVKKTNVWKHLVQKVFGEPHETLVIERCFEDYRGVVEAWRLNVEGFVDYARKIQEPEVLKEMRHVILQENQEDNFAKVESRRQAIMLAVVLSLVVVSLVTRNYGGMLALLLFLVAMLQVNLLRKEIRDHNSLIDLHHRVHREFNVCCASTRLLESQVSKAIKIISEIELVARGYYLKSMTMSPIFRIERQSTQRKCQRLRQVTLECVEMLGHTYLQGTPSFTELCPGIPIENHSSLESESVELLLSFSSTMSSGKDRSAAHPPDPPPAPSSTLDATCPDERYSLSRLKDSLRVLQEHRAMFFDYLFLGTSLRMKKIPQGSLTGNPMAAKPLERDKVTAEVLTAVSKWNKQYLHIVNPLLERLKYALNFESETPRPSLTESHHELIKCTNQLNGYLREVKARIYLIQQDIHEFSDRELSAEKAQTLDTMVKEQIFQIGSNLQHASKVFETLRRESERTPVTHSKVVPTSTPLQPEEICDPDPDPSTSSPGEAKAEGGDASEEGSKVFGDEHSREEDEPADGQDQPEVPKLETFEGVPGGEEEGEDDGRDEAEFFRRRKKMAGLSREERIELRRVQLEEEKRQRQALESNLEVLSELKNVLRQAKAQ